MYKKPYDELSRKGKYKYKKNLEEKRIASGREVDEAGPSHCHSNKSIDPGKGNNKKHRCFIIHIFSNYFNLFFYKICMSLAGTNDYELSLNVDTTHHLKRRLNTDISSQNFRTVFWRINYQK